MQPTTERRLIVSRKEDQSVTIEGPAVVEVVKVKGNRVTLAIRAATEVRIMRTEILERAA